MVEDGGLWQRQDGKQSNFGFGIYKGVFGMTRREEIEHAWLNKEVQSNHRYDERSFKEAVEWADKTMIEKACEWLKEHYAPAGFVEGIFRKAMEE